MWLLEGKYQNIKNVCHWQKCPLWDTFIKNVKWESKGWNIWSPGNKRRLPLKITLLRITVSGWPKILLISLFPKGLKMTLLEVIRNICVTCPPCLLPFFHPHIHPPIHPPITSSHSHFSLFTIPPGVHSSTQNTNTITCKYTLNTNTHRVQAYAHSHSHTPTHPPRLDSKLLDI